MTSQTSARTVQICRTCGGGAPVDVHFCPQCTKILALGRHGDYFSFLGVPRKLNVDSADLERNFRTLSRQFHPDYFYNATPAERRASLERASYLNDAYRTLRQPIARLEYLLELEGAGTAAEPGVPAEPDLGAGAPGVNTQRGQGASATVPPALLEEVFALNEELDEVRGLRAGGAPAEECKRRLERARQPIEARRAAHEAQLQALSAKWDAFVDTPGVQAERGLVLEALRERMLERNYINNLLAGVEKELTE